jgi:hypothetical protein
MKAAQGGRCRCRYAAGPLLRPLPVQDPANVAVQFFLQAARHRRGAADIVCRRRLCDEPNRSSASACCRKTLLCVTPRAPSASRLPGVPTVMIDGKPAPDSTCRLMCYAPD